MSSEEIASRSPISQLTSQLQESDSYRQSLASLSDEFDMFRPVPSTLDTARRLGLLEYLIRVTTSEDEAKPYIATFQGNLAIKITSLKKKSDTQAIRLEDELTQRDLSAMQDPSISLILYVLGDEGLLKKVIEPETGSSWPLMYLFSAGRFLCILYTPELTYLDGYNPLTGEAKAAILSPLLIDSIRPSLYHNKTKNTVSVQTDIVLTDPFEVTEDAEETAAPYDLGVAITGFLPLLRKTIGKERNKPIDSSLKSEEKLSEPSIGVREKLESREVEQAKPTLSQIFGGRRSRENTVKSQTQETNEQGKQLSSMLKKSNQLQSPVEEKRPKLTEPEQGKSTPIFTGVKNSPPQETKESALSAYIKPIKASPANLRSKGLLTMFPRSSKEEVPAFQRQNSKRQSKVVRVSDLELSQTPNPDYVPPEEVMVPINRRLTQMVSSGQIYVQPSLFEEANTFSALASEAVANEPVEETGEKDQKSGDTVIYQVSPLPRKGTRFTPGESQEVSFGSEEVEDWSKGKTKSEKEEPQVEEEDEELYRPSVKVPSKYRDECRCVVT